MISVIVPAYNLESYIARTLDSILAQTYSDIEVIVIDDGSQDGTGAIIDYYAERFPETVYAHHIPNGGVTHARLTGVEKAKGEWIGFVDGDDVIEPDMYERLLRNAQLHHAQISHCGYQMRFADGRVRYFHNTGRLVLQDKETGLKDLLEGSMIEPGLCNKLFHKNLLHSLFHEREMPADIKNNEDLLMNYYLFSAADISVFEDWCPYCYIVREGSASRAKLSENRIYDPIRVKEIIRKDAPNWIWKEAQRAYMNTCINTYHMLISAEGSYSADLRHVRNLLMKEKDSFHILGKKRRVMACLIIGVPVIYRLIYGMYCRFFQKPIYS